MFRKIALSLLATFLILGASLQTPFIAGVSGEIVIDAKDHIPNSKDGYCAWCALETLARYHHIESLYGIADRYKQHPSVGATPDDLAGELRVADVDHAIGRFGNHDWRLLMAANKKNLGSIVGLRDYPVEKGHHAVVLTHIDADIVKIVDSNHPGHVLTADRAWFDEHWTGWLVVIWP